MQRESPITQIQKYLPVQLTCPICQYEYDRGSHSPMLICINQHCACKECLQTCFEYSEYEDQALCPFCKEPIYSDYIERFRLMEEIMEATTGLNKYNNVLNGYINRIITEQKELEGKLEAEREKNAELAAKIQTQLTKPNPKTFQNQPKFQSVYSIPKPRTNPALSQAKINGTLRKESSKMVKKQKVIDGLATSKTMVGGLNGSQDQEEVLTNKYHHQSGMQSQFSGKTELSRAGMQQKIKKKTPSSVEITKPKREITHSSINHSKSKKDVSSFINNPSRVDPETLKLIAKKNGGGQAKEQRALYVEILVRYDFCNLRQLSLRALNLNETHLEPLYEQKGLFPMLVRLDLSKNRLNCMPQFISTLHSITFMDLSSNKIVLIPEWIKALTNLKQLDLWKNEIEVLPTSLVCLKKLKLLDLSNNKITHINRVLEQESPCKIDLFGNPIQKKK